MTLLRAATGFLQNTIGPIEQSRLARIQPQAIHLMATYGAPHPNHALSPDHQKLVGFDCDSNPSVTNRGSAQTHRPVPDSRHVAYHAHAPGPLGHFSEAWQSCVIVVDYLPRLDQLHPRLPVREASCQTRISEVLRKFSRILKDFSDAL